MQNANSELERTDPFAVVVSSSLMPQRTSEERGTRDWLTWVEAVQFCSQGSFFPWKRQSCSIPFWEGKKSPGERTLQQLFVPQFPLQICLPRAKEKKKDRADWRIPCICLAAVILPPLIPSLYFFPFPHKTEERGRVLPFSCPLPLFSFIVVN